MALGILCLPVKTSLCLAQEHAPGLYVAQLVGEWTVTGSSRPLRVLDRVASTASVGVAPGSKVTPLFALVLRDPISLRTASIRCDPVARCASERRVADLEFSGSAVPLPPRVGALFVQLSGSREEWRRVVQVGSRGEAADVGLISLAIDSAGVDLGPLKEGLVPGSHQRIVRLCPLVGEGGLARPECLGGPDPQPGDCSLEGGAPCKAGSAVSSGSVVTILVYQRQDEATVLQLLITGIAVLFEPDRYALGERVISSWQNDLKPLRGIVSQQEFRALETAAALGAAVADSLDGR